MTDLPILFSGPMVRAILEGRKTQTRRIIKPNQKDFCDPLLSYAFGRKQYSWPNARKANGDLIWFEPPWQLGEKLWVRETWHTLQKWDDLPPRLIVNDIDKIDYFADGYPRNPLWAWGKNRTCIFMPRWASRITLIVADVQVQRLQDITEDDARAEGFKNVGAFADYWDHLTKTHQWYENPWVSVVEFRAVFENIDKIKTIRGAG